VGRSGLLVRVMRGTRQSARVTRFPLGLPGRPAPAPVTREGSPELVARSTVPGLFAGLRSLLKVSAHGRPCGMLKVTFDPRGGHPRSLRYDNALAIDDEFSLTVSPLTPLR